MFVAEALFVWLYHRTKYQWRICNLICIISRLSLLKLSFHVHEVLFAEQYNFIHKNQRFGVINIYSYVQPFLCIRFLSFEQLNTYSLIAYRFYNSVHSVYWERKIIEIIDGPILNWSSFSNGSITQITYASHTYNFLLPKEKQVERWN